METSVNLLDIKVDNSTVVDSLIKITDKIAIQMKYPEFSLVEKLSKKNSAVDIAFEVVIDSIDYIFDGEQYYYANETPAAELMEFIESLNTEQFNKIEKFFENLPKLNKKVEIKCNKCGYDHSVMVEGLESFFG